MNFVDTNVLVQATMPAAPDTKRAQDALLRLMLSGPTAISRQVLREYVSVVTRPQVWAAPLSLNEGMQKAGLFANMFLVFEDGAKVWAELKHLASGFRFAGSQVHDANLVATMLVHKANRLLTFNTKHFRRFTPLIEVLEP